MRQPAFLAASSIVVAVALLALAGAPGAAHVDNADVPAALAPQAAADSTASATATVTVADFEFQDAGSGTPVTTIAPGDSVTWVWVSGTHSVTHGVDLSVDAVLGQPLAGAFDSGVQGSPGAPFTVAFPDAGAYQYYCLTHVGMRGVVVVA